MRAILHREVDATHCYELHEVERPVPGVGEVLIRVRAAAVNPMDWKLIEGKSWVLRLVQGLGKAKRVGVDVAGVVEAVGEGVTGFVVGQAVFGACAGAFAEFVCAKNVVAKPEGVSFEDVACVPVAGLTALQGLRDQGRLQAGQRVLVNGASGGVGTFAVQIAKALGGVVTGVCSGRNVGLVQALGADAVIDYELQDCTRGAGRYELVLDCVGNYSFGDWRRVLTPNGIAVGVGARNDVALWRVGLGVIGGLGMSMFVSQKYRPFLPKVRREDLALLGEWIAEGKVRPVIDRRYALDEVGEALRFVQQGRARGKVVIGVDDGGAYSG